MAYAYSCCPMVALARDRPSTVADLWPRDNGVCGAAGDFVRFPPAGRLSVGPWESGRWKPIQVAHLE